MAGVACDHFLHELQRVIKRFRSEYEMSYAEAIGCLTYQAQVLGDEAIRSAEAEEEEDDDED